MLATASVSSNDELARVSFETTFNLPFVQVQVEGSEPLWFLLDTGAQVVIVDASVAERIGLAAGGVIGEAGGGGAGTLELRTANDVSMQLADQALTFETVYITAVGGVLGASMGRRVDGILGYDFFQRFVVRFDYAAHELVLYDPATYRYEGEGLELPLTIQNNHPHVAGRLEMAGREVLTARFIVDTGASGAVFLATPFVDAHDLLGAGLETVTGATVGVGGLSEQRVGRIESLEVGPLRVERPPAFFSRDASGGFAGLLGAEGVLGAEILRRYTVTWSYAHQRLWLEPRSDMALPIPFDFSVRSGLSLQAEGADLATLRVTHVLPDSPASEAGIEIGDRLQAMDEHAADGLTLEAIRQHMEQPDVSVVRLRLDRDGEEIDVALRLRPAW